MENRRQNPRRFRPSVGSVYQNAGGGQFRCQYVASDGEFAWMQNTASGWTCRCHGIIRYEDGTIEWDYSLHGHFEKFQDREEEERRVIRMQILSMSNAMLCMI